ncbi:MAG: fibronectin type III domain-containing protein, partial [Actinomycetota bacterium]
MKTLRALILAVVSSTLSLTAVVVPMGGSTASAVTQVAHAGTVPGAPTGALATAGNGQATVTWKAPKSSGSAPITSYTVTSDTYLSAYPVRTCTTPDGSTRSCIVTGLTNGVLYAFTVTATNSAGTSAPSLYTNTVTPTAPPTPPTGVTARAGSSSAAISWTAPTSNGGAAISSYTASAFNANGTVASTCRTTTATNCTITGLTNGLTYTVSVIASNGTSTSTPSTPAVSVMPVGPPPAPGTPVAVPGNNQATVTWTAPISNGGSAISGYTVTSTTTANSCTATVTLSCTVTGLTNGRTYAFRVVARNASGTGTQSAASNSVIPGVIPGAPTNVAATAGNALATVTWRAPASNGGSPILRYVVTSTPGSVTCTTANGTTLSCVVSGLTNGTAYTFKVVAVNGIGSGPASTASAAVTSNLPPNVATNVVAVAGNAQATVSWTPAAVITIPIVSYTVSASPAGRRTTCTTANSSIHTCTVTGLTNGTRYTFTVVSNYASGKSAASAPSNPVTPATLPGAPTRLVVTAGTTSIIVSWGAPTSTGGSPITSYVATAFDGNGNAVGTCTTATLTCTITGLTTG